MTAPPELPLPASPSFPCAAFPRAPVSLLTDTPESSWPAVTSEARERLVWLWEGAAHRALDQDAPCQSRGSGDVPWKQ